MRLEYQILIAVVLDLAFGDPRWLPHPVRGIGWLALRFESVARRLLGDTRAAGAFAALSVYVVVGSLTWMAVATANRLAPQVGDLVSIFAIYTTIAARDLADHSSAVFRALARGDLAQARQAVGAIVGRDTDRLDEAGVARATVESVAESTVDGVTAPLFYAVLAGPVGAMLYRAINTLDSMFGHQDQRYGRFGWAAARIDDVANFLPARLTAPLICVAALVLRLRPATALRILLRDGRKHASPNAGLSEAAMAGALGVQLGGVDYYDGEPLEKPTIGEALAPLAAAHIRTANAVMFVTVGLFVVISVGVRAATIHLWNAWETIG